MFIKLIKQDKDIPNNNSWFWFDGYANPFEKIELQCKCPCGRMINPDNDACKLVLEATVATIPMIWCWNENKFYVLCPNCPLKKLNENETRWNLAKVDLVINESICEDNYASDADSDDLVPTDFMWDNCAIRCDSYNVTDCLKNKDIDLTLDRSTIHLSCTCEYCDYGFVMYYCGDD